MKKRMKNIKLLAIIIIVAFAACKPKRLDKQAEAPAVAAIQYTCPMHPQILEDKPGSCPICGMTLVKKSGQASEEAGINLNTVLQPVNSVVLSFIGAVVPQQKSIPGTITANGYLDFDTRTFNNIAARFSGRVEKVYITYAFQEIHTGQRILDIYSPELVNAQQELLFLLKNSGQEAELINAAKQKLLLLGVTNAQLNQLIHSGKPYYSLPVYSPYSGHVHNVAHTQMASTATTEASTNFSSNVPLAIKEGMYVEKGQTLFNVVSAHQLWAVIKIDREAMAQVKLGQPVEITLPDRPENTLFGKVDFIEPALRDGDKTTSIRVYLHNMSGDLKVNSLVKAVIKTRAVNCLWIPRSAVLDLGRTQIVWLKSGSLYKAHQVNTGIITGTEIQITHGLSNTDSIAANAAYLTDSESFIKTTSHE
jgi:Cu(I)/Ag(I) efflux system membrane fusion protein